MFLIDKKSLGDTMEMLEREISDLRNKNADLQKERKESEKVLLAQMQRYEVAQN